MEFPVRIDQQKQQSWEKKKTNKQTKEKEDKK